MLVWGSVKCQGFGICSLRGWCWSSMFDSNCIGGLLRVLRSTSSLCAPDASTSTCVVDTGGLPASSSQLMLAGVLKSWVVEFGRARTSIDDAILRLP